MRIRGIVVIVPTAIVAVVILAMLFVSMHVPNAGTANETSPYVHVINASSQGGRDAIGNTHYVISGYVENNGTSPSGHIQMQLIIMSDKTNGILDTTLFTPIP